MTMIQRLRILPLLVLVASLALLFRVGEFATGIKQAGTAFAQQEVEANPPPLPPSPGAEKQEEQTPSAESAEAKPETETKPEEEQAEGEAVPAEDHATGEEMPPPPAEGEGEKVDWKDASESEFDYSEVRQGLYEDLATRRREIETREKELATREALLEAAERELDQKIREMTAVRNEIEGLLKAQSEEESARVSSLVKIYEGMKAKDAANIFNTLDMDVLISVISRMSERKSGPILAEMDPARARAVTILLAQQKQIPAIPPQ